MIMSLRLWTLFKLMLTYESRSGRICSCQNPAACINSCMTTPGARLEMQPSSRLTNWPSPILPTQLQQLFFPKYDKMFNYQHFFKFNNQRGNIILIKYPPPLFPSIMQLTSLVRGTKRMQVFVWYSFMPNAMICR